MTRTPLLLAALAVAAPGTAQQVVEIDYSAGRTIIDDEWRAMHSRPVTADWDGDDDCVQKVQIGTMESERPCPKWTANLQPSFDDRGNLVLSSYDKRIAGPVVDIATGCHAIIRKDEERDMHLRVVAVRGDSVLVFHNDRGVHNGQPTVFANNAVKASVHPVRRISGEPCRGMLSG